MTAPAATKDLERATQRAIAMIHDLDSIKDVDLYLGAQQVARRLLEDAGWRIRQRGRIFHVRFGDRSAQSIAGLGLALSNWVYRHGE